MHANRVSVNVIPVLYGIIVQRDKKLSAIL